MLDPDLIAKLDQVKISNETEAIARTVTLNELIVLAVSHQLSRFTAADADGIPALRHEYQVRGTVTDGDDDDQDHSAYQVGRLALLNKWADDFVRLDQAIALRARHANFGTSRDVFSFIEFKSEQVLPLGVIQGAPPFDYRIKTSSSGTLKFFAHMEIDDGNEPHESGDMELSDKTKQFLRVVLEGASLRDFTDTTSGIMASANGYLLCGDSRQDSARAEGKPAVEYLPPYVNSPPILAALGQAYLKAKAEYESGTPLPSFRAGERLPAPSADAAFLEEEVSVWSSPPRRSRQGAVDHAYSGADESFNSTIDTPVKTLSEAVEASHSPVASRTRSARSGPRRSLIPVPIRRSGATSNRPRQRVSTLDTSNSREPA